MNRRKVDQPQGLRRRGTDVVREERLTLYDDLRRHIIIASWIGQGIFVVYGIFAGFSYGGLGGFQFFSDMYFLDRLGGLAATFGAVLGVVIGLICVWAILVIMAAAGGALVYYVKKRSFPSAP